MRKHWFIPGLFLAYSWILDAQRNNIWYFSRKAGLNFNQPVPAPLVNSAMNADEGCSSICDGNGNLLFYTNGVTVQRLTMAQVGMEKHAVCRKVRGYMYGA